VARGRIGDRPKDIGSVTVAGNGASTLLARDIRDLPMETPGGDGFFGVVFQNDCDQAFLRITREMTNGGG
jgi:hypothetical protein